MVVKQIVINFLIFFITLEDYKIYFEKGRANAVATGSIFHLTDQNSIMTRNYLTHNGVNVRS